MHRLQLRGEPSPSQPRRGAEPGLRKKAGHLQPPFCLGDKSMCMQAWSCPAVKAGVRGDVGRGGRAFPPSHPRGAIPASAALGTGPMRGSLRTVIGAEPRLRPRSPHPGPCLPRRLCSEGQRLKCRPRGWGEWRPPGPLGRRCVGS